MQLHLNAFKSNYNKIENISVYTNSNVYTESTSFK